ncbi:hypothetical protein PsorP6_015964 [Peronosclerospora sorghi]|uniref:Uncharacterized protein n=1 Tax=Peronosclerospora sorghi TaxID=230839 RepID=A0ACC0WMW1_9STRA|nr:hypothetical protein PsorP6_015964 [Peronosclerospora sorghi]
MAPIQDIEVEGVTTFAASPRTSYRYMLKLQNDELSIWMEDRTSKKQWYKGKMVKRDYVTSGNIISDAAAADYVRSFQDALNSELDESSDVQRTLKKLKGGDLQLDFEIKIHVLRSARVAKYTFLLDPVSVERIDVLESKLRDQQEELERLCGKNHEQSVRIELVASTTIGANLLWNYIDSDNFSVNQTTGEVSIYRPGAYRINAVVNVAASTSNRVIQLMKNGTCVQQAYVVYTGYGGYCSTPLSTCLSFEANDLVSVSCYSNIQQSYLSLVHLGV